MLKISIKKHQVTSHFALSNIQIKVKSGEIYALIGKSGSGKSTIANLLVGVKYDADYSITIDSKELNDGMDRLIPQFKAAGYVPQTLHLKPHHTVYNYAQVLFQYLPQPKQEVVISKYLKQFYLLKQKNILADRLPSLELLDDVMYKAIAVGFAFFTIATILGALWAADAWGGYWSWDPKETWALIVWLNYAAWLHMRLMKGLRGVVAAWWALVGLLVTTFAFLGVNMFLSGLHSYGTL